MIAVGIGGTEGSGELASQFLALEEWMFLCNEDEQVKLLPGAQEAASGWAWGSNSGPQSYLAERPRNFLWSAMMKAVLVKVSLGDIVVQISKLGTQVLGSKYHSLRKGIRVPSRNG